MIGEFEKAKSTLRRVLNDPGAAVFTRLAAADSLARVHLALGELDECDEALSVIDAHVLSHPELSSQYDVRLAAIPRARVWLRRGELKKALYLLLKVVEQAKQLEHRPLQVAAHIAAAQVLAKLGLPADASVHLFTADRLGATTLPELQAPFYYASALVLRESSSCPLEQWLHERALRLWEDQHVVSVRLEMNDGVEAVEQGVPPVTQ